MKEELHHLLDGDISDVESAGLLRALAEDGQDLSLFRQQMKLRQELSRNGCHDAMSASEESEMLDRVRAAIGLETPRATGTFIRRVLPFVAGSLLIGGGIGYMAHLSSTPPAAPPEVRQSTEIQTAPAPASATAVAPIDRDSLVRAVRDSMAQVMAKPAAPKKRVTHSGQRSRGSFDDPTGAGAARELAKKKKARQQ